jgi:hypothetical protein
MGRDDSSRVDVPHETGTKNSRKAAGECSPGRKPWGNAITCEALKGRKKAFSDIASWFCCRFVCEDRDKLRINFSCATKGLMGCSPSLAFRRLLDWQSEISRRTGLPVGRIARLQQGNPMPENGSQRFMRHAGMIDGSKDLSSRTGLSRR